MSIIFLSPRLVYAFLQDGRDYTWTKAQSLAGLGASRAASLRGVALTWLRQKGILHRALTTSSIQKKPALVASCTECRECTKQWIFYRLPDMDKMQVGEHNENKNEKNIRRRHAKEFATCKDFGAWE